MMELWKQSNITLLINRERLPVQLAGQHAVVSAACESIRWPSLVKLDVLIVGNLHRGKDLRYTKIRLAVLKLRFITLY